MKTVVFETFFFPLFFSKKLVIDLDFKVLSISQNSTLQCFPKEILQVMFYKQKYQLQMGMIHYKDAATPLSIQGINTTHQHC